MSSAQNDSNLRKVAGSRYSISLLSRTDSTVSNIPGAGRTFGSLLTSAGRRIEPVFSRAAERLGFGPTPLVRRILASVINRHNSKWHCNFDLAPENPSAQTILDMTHYLCPHCKRQISFEFNQDLRQGSEGTLIKLLQYLRCEAVDVISP